MKKIKTDLPGSVILEEPLMNKGTAFTEAERIELGLEGLLPFHVSTIEEQVGRRYANFCDQKDEMAKFTFLSALQNRNTTLFYRLVLEHLDEMVPLIYTPTVGTVSTNYSLLYREQRGLYLSYPHRDKLEQMVANFPRKEIDVIVVTDGERILGLGDLGVGGMAIPVGKLALYSLFGGIDPARVLPIVLDLGTNNAKMLEDPLYIGWRNQRIDGEDYDQFIEDFVQAIKKHYPNVLLQWEDFARPHALPLLNRYRNTVCSFNDDIQGTAAVALASVYSAVKLSKAKLKDQKFVLLGAGSAGLGICNKLTAAIAAEGEISEEEARKLFYLVDRNGLIHQGQEINIDQRPFAHDLEEISDWTYKDIHRITLTEVIENAHPTVLIGVSTQGGAFTEEVIKTMNKYVARPMIFPLSNPTSRSEAQPSDLIKWTKGQAIIATGSPFEPVAYEGNLHHIAQCNNVYIFPGVGLGLIAAKARFASDAVFIEAAKILSSHSPILKDPYGPLFPTLDHLRDVTREIGIAVAKLVIEEGNSSLKSIDSVEKLIDETIWYPDYPIYTR
ncbi:MAG: NAD-dependent malic enzyme [Simkaniaceae bacterium]|nr:NAD-dependent malic enzyme [Candidatus Sacchlamyda saccharinae]